MIATRANLVAVKLQGEASTEIQRQHAPAALVSTFLRAIQQNSAIREVFLLHLRLPTDVSTFVDIASSITALLLLKCEIMAPSSVERDQGTRDLAAALQRNTNIKRLRIGSLDEVCNCAILQGLRSNASVNSLTIGGLSFPDATAGAIQQLLQSTVSIETFGLCGTDFNNGDMFPLVAQSLIRSPIVCGLKFVHCRFKDEESAAQFRSILRDKRNLTGLCLKHCDLSEGPVQVHADIISALLQPDSPLQSFELEERSLGDALLPNSQFQNLLRAVEKSKLECFVIGDIESHEQLRTLTESIPRMRVKELQVVIATDEQTVNKQLLLQAVRNNFSLRSVDGKRAPGRDLFNDNDRTRLVFYSNRNELLDQWVDKPEMVERKVWPEALKLAEKAGPDSFFRGLRSVLGGDYVSLRAAGRKRKRPQYYAPS